MNKIKQIFLDWSIFKRVLITLLLILLFRLGTLVTLPGAEVTGQLGNEASFLSLLNMLGGGGLTQFSIFALGVTPYITASIIIQLLSTDVVPPLARLNKQGEKGRIKIEKITRMTAIFIAIIQSLAISLALIGTGYVTIPASGSQFVYVLDYTIILVAGSMVSIWIADQITMYGIGNGTSMLILVGILAVIPQNISNAWNGIVGQTPVLTSFIFFFFYIFLFLIVIMFIGWFEKSERQIPIQQTGRGLNLMKTKQTHMPLKVNPAGVIPVIFASSIMTLPPTIAQFFPDTQGKYWIEQNFALTAPFGLSLYGLLVFLFTLFYANININAQQTAENFQKQSTFIIGVKPGEDTERYIGRSVTALSVIGAIFLTFIATLPYLLGLIGIPTYLYIGGTSTIILVSVSLETWSQLNARIIASEAKAIQTKSVKKTKERKTLVKNPKLNSNSKKQKSKDNNNTILFD